MRAVPIATSVTPSPTSGPELEPVGGEWNGGTVGGVVGVEVDTGGWVVVVSLTLVVVRGGALVVVDGGSEVEVVVGGTVLVVVCGSVVVDSVELVVDGGTVEVVVSCGRVVVVS